MKDFTIIVGLLALALAVWLVVQPPSNEPQAPAIPRASKY